ncbi:unnamed protein product [Closterium sp. Yama58-4]|nr:unnamed protein product [Closterium sp. Yama58-4]
MQLHGIVSRVCNNSCRLPRSSPTTADDLPHDGWHTVVAVGSARQQHNLTARSCSWRRTQRLHYWRFNSSRTAATLGAPLQLMGHGFLLPAEVAHGSSYNWRTPAPGGQQHLADSSTWRAALAEAAAGGTQHLQCLAACSFLSRHVAKRRTSCSLGWWRTGVVPAARGERLPTARAVPRYLVATVASKLQRQLLAYNGG